MKSYIRKQSLELTPLGDDEGIVFFDSETGDVHILDDIAADILNCFENKQDISKTVDALCSMYNEERSVIEMDVKEFVEQLLIKGLLIPMEE